MILSIITINRNNAIGLEKTMLSVLSQNRFDFEYIIVDGASTDGSVEVIRRYSDQFNDRLKWISETDTGIYNAMNKGIQMASGMYLEFLNSGDSLVSERVISQVYDALKYHDYPSILYGNMLKEMPDGTVIRDNSFEGQDISFLNFYRGTLNHSSSFIKSFLFNEYGFYDESLRIVSDWKWFLKAIVLGRENPEYINLDISLFDMNGISEMNNELGQSERQRVLTELIPQRILNDYNRWSDSIAQMRRIKHYPLINKIVWFLERCLFKIEKIKNKNNRIR
jgi:glycosyltransferase involved in cell wall biosynthesis